MFAIFQLLIFSILQRRKIGTDGNNEVQFRLLYNVRDKAELTVQSIEKQPDGTNQMIRREILYQH